VNGEANVVALMVGDDDVNDDERSYSEYYDFTFHQSHHRVNKDWILLDNCSTTNIFCNKMVLSNIRYASTTLKKHCNAGMVWYINDAIANIL
jgi:hypothetical protein